MTVMTLPNATNKYEFYTPEELLEFYRRGEMSAFGALIDQCAERLFAFLYHYLGNYQTAVAAYKQTWQQVAQHAHEYNEQARFAFWLYQLAREVALAKIENAPVLVTADKIISIITDKLPANITVEELGRRLTQAMMALPLAQKEVFLLREDADLTYWEISEILDCPRETAQNNLRAALGNLADALCSSEKLQRLLGKL